MIFELCSKAVVGETAVISDEAPSTLHLRYLSKGTGDHRPSVG